MDGDQKDWIGADWGTTNLRVWVFRDGECVRRSSGRGMSTTRADDFENVLVGLIGDLLDPTAEVPVVVCGMAGARQGWTEAPYIPVPAIPPGLGKAVRVETNDKRLTVHILPGMSQADPPDIMRGEETQISGFLQTQPDFDGVLCMPGTHTKWVQISAGEVVSFRTYMTGELFALISTQSVLRHSMDDTFDEDAFMAAVRDGMADPQALAGRFFALRAEGLVAETQPGMARARLSGFLIGAELAAAKPYWLGQRVALLGAGKLSDLYAKALAAEGVLPEIADVTEATLAGLTAAYETLKDAP